MSSKPIYCVHSAVNPVKTKIQFTNGSKLMSIWGGNPLTPIFLKSTPVQKRNNRHQRTDLPLPWKFPGAAPVRQCIKGHVPSCWEYTIVFNFNSSNSWKQLQRSYFDKIMFFQNFKCLKVPVLIHSFIPQLFSNITGILVPEVKSYLEGFMCEVAWKKKPVQFRRSQWKNY